MAMNAVQAPLVAFAATQSDHGSYPGAMETGDSGVKKNAQDVNPLIRSATDSPVHGKSDDKTTQDKNKHTEIVSKRTANTETFDLGNGKRELRQYAQRVHYKEDGKWQKIDTTLVEDNNAGESGNVFGKALGAAQGKLFKLDNYKLSANDWQAKFGPSDERLGMVRIEADGKKIAFAPRDANSVQPQIKKQNGIQMVIYKNLWDGVDVYYSIKSDALKEEIVLTSAKAVAKYAFTISGADLKQDKDGGFSIDGSKQTIAPLSVTTQQKGTVEEQVVKQSYKDDVLTITTDSAWLKSLKSDEFPVIIDPTWNHGTGTVSWNYTAFKSNGYSCPSSSCYMNAGSVNDGGWKYWRTAFRVDFSELQGKRLMDATMWLPQANRSGLIGYNGPRYVWMSHATCIGYNCVDGGAPSSVALANNDAAIDVKALVQSRINIGDWGAWFMLTGEEGGYYTWKGFDPDLAYMAFNYNYVPPTPGIIAPSADGQVFIDPQPSFSATAVSDPEGDPMQYNFVVTGTQSQTGLYIQSGWQNSTQWTVPDGILQDGGTYYLSVSAWDGNDQSGTATRQFKIDSRRGKDKTQTYDTVGPVDIDLTNGNVSTSVSSHDTTALGGSLGVSLDYNAPMRSRAGLVASYWNNYSQSGTPTLTRVDKNVGFNWTTGSPSANVINNDSFSARWTGYFAVPKTGTYYFGGSNDDGMSVQINSQTIYNQGCYSGVCYDMTHGVSLTAGQLVPIQVDYAESSGPAYALLFVKGAVAEQVVPSEWLQTGARSTAVQHGLTGSYYANNTGYNLDANDLQLLMRRVDSTLAFQWNQGGPAPNLATDFMVRWGGYITLPEGDYNFGTNADDNAKITIGNQIVVNNYNTTPCCVESYGTTTHFAAGIYPIKIDYYDVMGGASFNALVKVNNGASQIIPASWLTPSAQTLPAGWQLGIDPDGNLSYDHLSTTDSTVILSDSTGDTHTYTWSGTAYKPPVNEDGQLTRGADGRYTLIDTDGRIYVFKSDGTLESVTNPTDDLHPAALQYTYEGTPAHVTQISDGVDSGRWAKVYYVGDGKNMCAARPDTSYIDPSDQSILGYICGVRTNDGRITSFYYANFGGTPNLALVVKPGNERTSYQYDGTGLMTAVRDTLAEDAVAASIRTNDATTLTQVAYDILGRANSVKAPAATAGATRQEQTIEYLPYAMPFVRYISGGDRYVTTGTPPLGYVAEPHINVSMLLNSETGTHAVYSCKAGSDQFISLASDCEGQSYIGIVGYAYDNATADGMTVPIYRCVLPGDHFVSQMSNCEGFNVEGLMGYIFSGTSMLGSTKEHITGDAEPNGYTRKVEYDATLRTTHDTDVTGKQTWQQWDTVKDLLYSTTDAVGLKSTSLYDGDDRPTDSYGPAPKEWFGSDNKPTSTYLSQVPHSSTGYDENINGLAVSWYDAKTIPAANSTTTVTLTGAPKLHTTSFDGAAQSRISMDSTNSSYAAIPVTKSTDAQGVGFRSTGKFIVPTTGTYTFTACHDDALRVTVNDNTIIDDWSYVGASKCTSGTTDTLTAGSYIRFSMDYANVDNGAYNFNLNLSGAASITNASWGSILKPDYSLQTSQTTYNVPTTSGSTATQVSTTNYGSKPEYGLVQSTSTDSTNLNLTATSTYEAPGAVGSYLRQTSSSLPGGATTNYVYYGATETRQNPCSTSQTFRQGGMLKFKTEPDPDGAGAQTGRVTETVYDDAGKVVATRYNTDAWTCTTYDSRERVATTSVPAYGDADARTVTNNYAVSGNPLVTSSNDASGTITVQTDLLGRNVQYTDAHGSVTTSTYDSKGHLSQRVSPLGTEDFVYDDYDRLVDQKLDNVTYAHVTYDQYSRIDNVTYPAAGQQKLTYARDTLGRLSGMTYDVSTAPAGPGPNLVTNPGFETSSGSPAAPTSWQQGGWGTNTRSLTYQTSGRTGTKSVKTQITAYTNGDAKWFFNPVNVTANTSYTFKDYYKSNITSDVVAEVTLANNSLTYINLGSPTAQSTNWTQTNYTFTTPANATKVTVYHLIDAVGWLQVDDVELFQTSTGTASSTTLSDTVTRAATGDVISGTELGQAKTYGYDTAGRLISATVAGNNYTYSYGTQAAACTGLAGTNANAGKDSNRTSQTINGATTTFCYDQADRLIASSDAQYNTPTYDSHGNTTKIGTNAAPLSLCYDGSDRNTCLTSYNASGNGTAIYYNRDAQGRIIFREADAVNAWTWTTTSEQWYGYTASGDTPDFIKDTNGNVTEKYLTLPGDVVITIRPGATGNAQKTYSLPNIHGDIFATTDATGVQTGTFQTGPFGEKIGTTTPNNTATGTTFGYVGKNEKVTESSLALQPVQMGARVYIPGLGRFTSVDPTPGGNVNTYSYGTDPINEFDLDGNSINWRKVGGIAATIGGVGAAVACGASVVCGIAAGAVASAAVYSAQNAGTKKFTAKGFATSTVIGGTLGRIGAGGSSAGIKATGTWVSKALNGGRSRVSLSATEHLDLVGKAHFVKSIGKSIPTPHIKNVIMGPKGPIKTIVRRAGWNDMRRAIQTLRRK